MYSGTVEQTAKEIRDQGGEALAIAYDVSDEDQVQAMVRQVIDHYGRIDVLVAKNPSFLFRSCLLCLLQKGAPSSVMVAAG